MSGFESGTQTVIESIKLLLETGRFSDLALVCHEEKFHVHKAIVCARSPVWAAAVEKGFKESHTNEIEVDIVDAFTLKHALTYLYTGAYDDGMHPPIDCAVSRTSGVRERSNSDTSNRESQPSTESVSRAHNLVTNDEEVDVSTSMSSSEVRAAGTQAQNSNKREQMNMAEVSQEVCHGCRSFQKGQLDATCVNTKLQVNTLVYVLADYYQIPDLKNVAVRKFGAALEDVCPKDLGDVCRLVYEHAPCNASDLRLRLSNAIASHGHRLIEDASFMDTAILLPELLRDAWSHVARQQQITSSERDAALAASLKAEEELIQANTKGEEGKKRVIAEVNQARRCRHCRLENNVCFEFEGSNFGISDYSFRCKCRTRY